MNDKEKFIQTGIVVLATLAVFFDILPGDVLIVFLLGVLVLNTQDL